MYRWFCGAQGFAAAINGKRSSRSWNAIAFIAFTTVTLTSATAEDRAAFQPATASEETVAATREYLATLHDETGFNAAVLVAKDDDILIKDAFGYADFELGVKLRPDHIFRIGSMTKSITASAIMKAVEEGDLSFDDPVCAYLDPCPAPWQELTMHHLLTHTSGIPELFGELKAVPVEETAAELKRALRETDKDLSLEFDPGSEYRYHNFNYVLLGYILEKTTGRLWQDYLVAKILDPAGADSIHYDDVDAIVPGRVHGYGRGDDGAVRKIDYDDHAAYSAGGLLATTGDYFRWFRALVTGKLVGPESLKAAFAPNLGYGYGWRIRPLFDRNAYFHTGGIDGFSTFVGHFPGEGLTFLVFSNIEEDNAILPGCDLMAIFVGWHRQPTGTEEWVESHAPQQRCGIEP